MEVWRDIEGYEGYYQVSNLGRVRSLDRIVVRKDGVRMTYKGKVKKPTLHKDGYLEIGLCKDCKQKHYLVHRLVAETFIPNPNNLLEINHKDENKMNNNVENLEWCDRFYNMNYGTIHSRTGRRKPVVQLTIDGEFINKYVSASDAARALDIKDCTQIIAVINDRAYTAYGFCWCTIDEYEKYFRAD